MRILRARNYRLMPWRNGGGETAEIAVFPPEADSSNFDWRISMATVGCDGPFSVFPDTDRTLSIVDGEGLELAVADRVPVQLSPESAPYYFPADLQAKARILGGPVVDLNVMTRRGVFEHSVRRIDIDGEINILATGNPCMMICSHGKLGIEVGKFAAELDCLDSLTHTAVPGSRVAIEGQGTAFIISLREMSSRDDVSFSGLFPS